jgi:hypothetical protein
MEFFQGVDHKYVIIEILTNNHFVMEGDEHCELGKCINSISNTYFND